MVKSRFRKRIHVEEADKPNDESIKSELGEDTTSLGGMKANGSGMSHDLDEESEDVIENSLPEVEPGASQAEEPRTEIEVDKERIAKLEAEAKENYDKYLRAIADLENYKKRTVKERADLLRYAGEQLARDLLEVVDDLERAVALGDNAHAAELWKGIKLVLDKFHETLERHSIKAESAVNKKFDPHKHSALTTVPTKDHEDGTVIEELKKAYYFRDKLIRTAQVIVAKTPDGQGGEGVKGDDKPEENT